VSALTNQDRAQKRTALLTGATGFLGSHLLKALLSAGYKVVILKRTTSDTWRIANFLNQVTSYDIDSVPLTQAFEDQRIDGVIHTACHYGRNGDSAHQIVETNLMLGLKLLDAASLFNADTFLNTDTFFNTNTLLQKHLHIYRLSEKQFVEWLYQSSDKIQIINLKLEHLYGPLDDTAKFMPWVLSQLEQKVEIINLTAGGQLRDFIYVDDVVSAYLATLQKAAQLPAFNEFDVGTGVITSVRKLVENA
jgi:CDP-paratose synthetase